MRTLRMAKSTSQARRLATLWVSGVAMGPLLVRTRSWVRWREKEEEDNGEEGDGEEAVGVGYRGGSA